MRERNTWPRKLGALVMALALCVGLLPATALATGENSWEHTSHDSGWTALTADKLTELGYTLSNGKYYLSAEKEDLNAPYSNMFETMPITVAAGAEVTLCINDVMYTYNGSEESAIIVNEGASLTICCCGSTQYAVLASNGSYAVKNNGTLNMASGRISSSKEYGAPIYNAGTCTISGGKVSGSAGGGWEQPYKTAYGVYNAENGNLTITGNPEISGRAPGGSLEPTGPQIDVYTSNTINVQDLSNEFEGIKIGFYGEDGGTVVSGVTDADTAQLFTVTDPANSELTYNETDSSLTFKKGEVIDYGSLYFAGEPVVNQTKYKIEIEEGRIFSATLVEVGADSEDYDLLWNEETKTLTLNSATARASCEYESGSTDDTDALISLNCDEETTLTITVIGENHLTALNPFTGWNSGFNDTRVIENPNGDIVFTGNGNLTVEVVADKYDSVDSSFTVNSMTAIYDTGDVENKTTLTVKGSENNTVCTTMTGVECDAFTNSGTFTANISDAGSACGVDTGNFENSGTMDIDLTDVANGTGIWLTGGTSFENSGKIDIAIPDADSARGIGRYSESGEAADGDFTWTNTEGGNITITVSGDSAATAALGGQTLAGMDLRSGEDITFTNDGTITATAASNGPAALKETNWPSWQYFDTLGILLLCDEGTFTNTGDMKLTALNGYTAGISIGGTNDYDISITNSGNLNITTTTKGGNNIRSVGIYAQIPGIESGAAQQMPFNTTDGTVSISTSAADGSTVDSDNLMAICLVQTFTAGTTVPSDTGAFQQIIGEGMALSGQPVVLKVENDGKNQTAFINTIGTVSEDGTVTPATGMTVVPAIAGTVTIQGTPQVGSTLTAQVSGLPDGVDVTYQWQAADSAEGPFTDIQGATESTYTPTNDQVGQYLRVVVKPVGEAYGGALTATTTQAVVKPYIPPANPNYKITVEDTQGGTVVVTPTSAKAGTTVTIAATPDEGFAVDTVTVTDRFGEPLDVTENPNGTYTFVMPDGQVTVHVTFTETAPEPLPFTDVTEGDWFYDAVRYAYENSLMDGVGGNRFAPNSATTRAQLVTILYRLEGQPAVSGDLPFTDVESGTWYTNAVLWAAQNGIVNGVNDTEFAPGDDLTRQQLVTILYRYAEAKGYDVSASADLSGYPDAGQVQDYAQPAMAWAVAEGIVEGMDGNLNPAGNASRAQIATILMRFCEDAAQ